MSARDELAKLLFVTDNHDAKDPEHEWEMTTRHNQDYSKYAFDMADAILAAGYRRPRTITTAEELGGPVSDMAEVLLEHLRTGITGCRCGWADLGRSHTGHLAAALSAAGFGPVREARAQALEDAADAGDPQDTSLFLFTLIQRAWLRTRAAAERGGEP